MIEASTLTDLVGYPEMQHKNSKTKPLNEPNCDESLPLTRALTTPRSNSHACLNSDGRPVMQFLPPSPSDSSTAVASRVTT